MLAALCARTAAAQGAPESGPRPDSTRAPRPLTLSPYLLLYTALGTVDDPSSLSTWWFADAAVGGGAAAHFEFNAFALGVDAAFTRTRYERRSFQSAGVTASGKANIATLLFNGRLSSGALSIPGVPMPVGRRGGEAGGLATFVSVGAGTIWMDLDDLEEIDVDFGLAGGGGIEYRWDRGTGVFLEWKRVWQFHEREGVESAVVDHSLLDAGARIPLR